MAIAERFRRLAIVNRGEPAMRVIHAVRELNEQRPEPIEAIAFHTEPERRAMFVRHADEAYCIGPATVPDPAGGTRNGYLDLDALERGLRETGAEAAWVGWGFVAERPEFVDLCERLGVVFVGPSAAVMRKLGDKIESKRLAERAGVPVAPWSGGPVETLEAAIEQAERIGFPLMVKATAGGGGRGIRRIDRPEDLADGFASARSQARSAFGDGTVLMERLITPARHVEVQVIADGVGTAWALGVRDCSCQRRHQKVIEESASPALDPEQEAELLDGARRMVLDAGYRNAATVEFLYQPDERRFSFMEVNARLQVEHPVTEMVTGADLVKLQLHVAAGGRLEGKPPAPRGHAIEVRLNAEDPALGFVPTPGRVEVLELPTGPGLRIDTGIAAGDSIPPDFDSMIAKLIAWGSDRGEALARLRSALRDTLVLLEDGSSNQSFLLGLLGRPELQSGEVDTTWLDRITVEGGLQEAKYSDVALVQAAIELAHAEADLERAAFFALARRGRPSARVTADRPVQLRYRGQGYELRVAHVGPGRYRISVDGAVLEVGLDHLSPHERRLELAGSSLHTVVSRQGGDLLVEVDHVPHRIARDDGGIVRSRGPGVVVALPAEPGETVEAGDVVAVIESMKMAMSLTAPVGGRVRKLLVGTNVQVGSSQPLVAIELAGDQPSGDGRDRVEFTTEAAADLEPARRCEANLERLEWLALGYDVGAAEVRRAIDDMEGVCADLLACGSGLIDGEHRLLGLYADLKALDRPRHQVIEVEAGEEELLRSPQEHFHAFLRSLDTDAEGLPPHFIELLERALAHYGVTDLDRTEELERVCYRIALAQQRSALVRDAVIAILDRRLERSEELLGETGPEFRDVLDRLESATEGRDPVVADLAREVRYRFYDQPPVTAARDRLYAEMGGHLDALIEDPGASGGPERIDALVRCPQPLAPQLSLLMTDAPAAARGVLLEVTTRRFFRLHDLEPFTARRVGGLDWALSGYEQGGTSHHLAAAFIELDRLDRAVAALAEHATTFPAGDAVVAELYARAGEIDHDALSDRLQRALEATPVPLSVGRIVLAAAAPEHGSGMSAVGMLTLRRDGDGAWEEEVELRDLHPEMAERLELWRFSEFELERLPSPEDVYFFRGKARSNPADERLFVLAEVRDLTAVRDERGEITALPEIERMYGEALEAMRGFQAHRPTAKRLLWNRVLLFCWPVIEIGTADIRRLVARYARAAAGLGIEMVAVRGRIREEEGGARECLIRFFAPTGGGVSVEVDDPPRRPLLPLDEGARRITQARRRGTVHPAELVKMLAPARSEGGDGLPAGEFVEHDLGHGGRLEPIDRPPALNDAGVVAGTVRNFTDRYPEGMTRVILLGDPTKGLGSLAEPECRRIIAACDLATEMGVPLEWFAISAGAKIAMDSGTENMDWISAVLRRIIEFTQAGHELNVVVTGINVGAQPYWNAEATMLMHTRGILVMTPESAMVLTGKQSLDYSGGVSAEDNFGIGGYERIMGPNGQAQYWAPDLAGACRTLLAHYDHAYVAPGERFPRRARTDDPVERDVRQSPHHLEGSSLQRVGDVFSAEANPGRKQAFDIRSVMRATIDGDHRPLERWAGMRDAEAAVVWDAHLGGFPVVVLGIESHPLPRFGPIPADGPDQWTSGTLFPRASKKIARAINAASGRQPLVALANLSGFDGSPESMREWQLEFGAEIGRAVVNFDGPIVFCVVSRYHGGAFVVFSQKLNEGLETIAVEGSHASVIGGAPAAAVVFARQVRTEAQGDPRVAELDRRIEAATGAERLRLRSRREAIWREVHAEKVGEFAERFDAVHSVERAVEMGSVSRIIPPERLRPVLIDAVAAGIERAGDDGGATRGDGRLAQPLTR